MHLQGVPNKIMCRVFPTTLKGPVKVWLNKLTPNTVSTFKELNGHFITHFIGGQRYKRSSVSRLKATGRWNLKVIRDSFQQVGPFNWRRRRQSFGHRVHQWTPVRRVRLLHLQEWPEDNGWHVIQGHKVYECWGRHNSSRGQTEEKGKTRRSSSRQRKKVCSDEWPKGR